MALHQNWRQSGKLVVRRTRSARKRETKGKSVDKGSHQFCTISESEKWMDQAAHILTRTFIELGNHVCPDFESAHKEVIENIQEPNVCIGFHEGDTLLGWTGLRPMYKETWEMQPLVVDTQNQRKGIGRSLLEEIERIGREKGTKWYWV